LPAWASSLSPLLFPHFPVLFFEILYYFVNIVNYVPYSHIHCKEITSQIGGPLILHVCGNCNDRLDLFAQAGFDAYHFEWQMDAKKVVEKVGDRISLVGCINNARVLYQGTPDDAYQQARYAIEAGVNIIGPECAIPLATPLENLKAIVSAVKEGF
jgi:uroporphyrinogen-III decarboxylase